MTSTGNSSVNNSVQDSSAQDDLEQDIVFVHLTDIHFSHSESTLVYGSSPVQKLERVLNRIRAMEIEPDFFLISGDLVNNGEDAEYLHFQENLGKVQAFGVPVMLGLGNHDDRAVFRRVMLHEPPSDMPAPYYHSQEIAGVNVIMLDSHVTGKVVGLLDQEQLSWLDAELSKSVPQGHLIVLHHPPVPCTVDLLNVLGLQNAEELAAIVHCHQNVLGVLSGHIHYSHVAKFANTISVTTPGVLYTVDPGVRRNIRTLDGSGFAIGTVRNSQLMMNTMMMPGEEIEISYREVDLEQLDTSI